MPDTTEVVQDYSAYKELAELPIWQGFILQRKKNGEGFDKIPNNGYGNISTSAPKRWVTLADALEAKAQHHQLAGVTLNMTGGIDDGPWRLVGLDFDDVDFDNFALPFPAYAELSPSGRGIRAFCWAPATYLSGFKDTTGIAHPGCDHAEVYFDGTPRHLTVTGRPINGAPIARLESLEPLQLERFKVKADTTAPEIEAGVELNLQRFTLTLEQQQLVAGTGDLDRSAIMHGLIIRLIDAGAPNEDVLATIVKTPALWQYCLDHRHDDSTRALQFAREEIARGYAKSLTGMRANLLGFNRKDAPGSPVQSAPAPVQAASAFPVALYDEAPGLVGDIAMWLVHASCAPRVEFAYACALVVVSSLIGPYVTFGDDDGKVNLYIALVGGTGSGKTKAIAAACKLLSYTDAKDRIQDFPASEAALRRQLNVTSNILIRADELAHKIDSFKGNSNGSGLSRAVLGMYDCDRLPPKVYTDDKKSLPAVENPFVQILGGTTAKIWDTLQTEHLEDGTLNRFIFVSLPEQAPYSSNRRASNKIDKTFKDRLNAFFRQSSKARWIGNQHVSHAPEVQAALEALGPVIYEKQQGPFGELYGRFTLHVEKIAVILAVGDGRMTTSMTDYAQALAFMEWSVEATYAKASTELAGDEFEKSTKKVVSLLSRAKGKMRLRDLYKALHRPKREVEELLGTMEISGIIKRTEGETYNTGLGTEWVHLREAADDEAL